VDERLEVRDITVERDKQITIVFGDGAVATFDLVELRVHCPCAGCRGERERGIVPWPKPTSPQPLAIEDAALHGAWGLAITWNDDHRAGIFPFSSLRQWHDDGEPSLTPDSGLRS
jgi:DUF971 family protein